MNKDVIYIEPEDDITDIITKIENSKEKIIALVPPKKAGVFRSAVNIKLIAKASNAAEKKVVLVTTDPSILKLAAVSKILVTKDLKTVPTIPEEEDDEGEVVKEELVEESDGTVETEEDVEELNESEEEKEEEEEEKKESKKATKKNKAKNESDNWFKKHRKLLIFGGIGLVLLIILMIWAFVIAPAVTISVDIRTSTANFSQNVTFTTKLTEEKADEGHFYLEEKKLGSESKVEFEATGKKNVGEKAKGEVVVYAFFVDKGKVAVNAGSTFSISGLSFVSLEDFDLSWDGEDIDECDNSTNASQLIRSGCQISGRLEVVATEPGTKYNIRESVTGWSTTANVGVYSDKAMSGGTDQMVTVVQQSDIDKAKTELNGIGQDQNKEKLLEGVKEDMMAIDSSFNQTTADAVSTPAVGEEVKEGEKASLKAVTTTSIYLLDKTKVEQFILAKTELDDDQKVYEMRNPFVENFIKTDDGYAGKLKTSYAYGPKITENEVVEITKGKGLGVANHDLSDINGVSSVHIDPSYPWVMSVPSDANKITVVINLLDNN